MNNNNNNNNKYDHSDLGIPDNGVAGAALGATSSVLMGKTQQRWFTAFNSIQISILTYISLFLSF